jgi:hypothetical protein
MAMTFFNLQKSKPFIQMDEGNFRLAMLWPDMNGRVLPSLPSNDRDALVNEQLWMEYEMGIACWIQRKVVNHFNTFSTECWV